MGVLLLLTLEKNRHREDQHINVISIQLNMVAAPITNAIWLLHPGFHKKTLTMCTEMKARRVETGFGGTLQTPRVQTIKG